MRLPDWIDVALEGGAVELQRALVRYRSLRRLLAGDWRSRAAQVADACAALAHREEAVVLALGRAMQRARYDPNAGAAAHLAIAVERERRRATALLGEECGLGEGPLHELLDHLEGLARDECYLETAWQRFHVERLAFTTVIVLAAAMIPAGSWYFASYGGFVPTVLALDAVVERTTGQMLLGAGVLLFICRLRVGAWSWLGVRFPSIPPAGAAIIYTALGLNLVGALFTRSAPITWASIVALAGVALLLLRAMWFPAREPLLAPLK